MTTVLTKLKNINETSKSLCFGFVREIEKELSLLTIPMMIKYLVLTYFERIITDRHCVLKGTIKNSDKGWNTYYVYYSKKSSNYTKIIHKIDIINVHKRFIFGYIYGDLEKFDHEYHLGANTNINISSSFSVGKNKKQIEQCHEMKAFALIGTKSPIKFGNVNSLIITMDTKTEKVWVDIEYGEQEKFDIGCGLLLYPNFVFAISLPNMKEELYLHDPEFVE